MKSTARIMAGVALLFLGLALPPVWSQAGEMGGAKKQEGSQTKTEGSHSHEEGTHEHGGKEHAGKEHGGEEHGGEEYEADGSMEGSH